MIIVNFYCVKNEAIKNDENEDFVKYCELRDGSKAYYIKKDCSRKSMNMGCDKRGSSGINILWPNDENEDFKVALKNAKEGKSPNNISSIMKYSLKDGAVVLWMGDIESDLMEKIKDEVEWPEVDLLFAPHHGRDSGKIPDEILKKLNPKIIIIGEASSSHLNYYQGYNTITQNSAGDITFECVSGKIHIYVSKDKYQVDFLEKGTANSFEYYLGTLNL